MGVAAARLVMVENVDDEGKPLDTKPAPAGSVALPILALLGITAARAAGEILDSTCLCVFVCEGGGGGRGGWLQNRTLEMRAAGFLALPILALLGITAACAAGETPDGCSGEGEGGRGGATHNF